MPLRPPDISAALLLLLVGNAVAVTGADAEARSGYEYGQNVPVSCLNRDIETGEHITDQTGHLQYIPFPTCNETSSPLAFHYGVSETITCTIPSISDSLYHLFEYYVHADVPMACRIPTTPLLPAVATPVSRDRRAESGEERHDSTDGEGVGDSIPFTPLTIALQGTLQLSHLHMWTDMSVVLHQSARLSSSPPSSSSKKQKQKQKKKNKNKNKKNNKGGKDHLDPTGQILSGSAYSVPLVLPPVDSDSDDTNNKKPLPKNPWAPGSGAKIIRGEPLTFTFRVGWMAAGDVLELVASPSHSRSSSGISGFTLWVVICFVMAVGVAVGMVIARGGGKGGLREGILGRTTPKSRKGGYGLGGYGLNGGGGGNGVGVGIGNGGGGGGGYGGYGGYGYGGSSGVGKRD
ncbi:hypothetical protein FQN53_002935 [Emmonsiellopsis sp. PD_33]|nr:hypothetical protein FQN53_002935 [Emmonsiellopsis sp. PD_33]